MCLLVVSLFMQQQSYIPLQSPSIHHLVRSLAATNQQCSLSSSPNSSLEIQPYSFEFVSSTGSTSIYVSRTPSSTQSLCHPRSWSPLPPPIPLYHNDCTFFTATLTLTTGTRGTDFGTLGVGADLGGEIASTLFSFYFFDSSMAFLGSYLVRFWRFSASFGSLFLPFTFFTYSSTYTSYSSSSICLGIYLIPPIGISSQLG